jgi:hypothetical protein
MRTRDKHGERLGEALRVLLKKKTLENITVGEILAKAKESRYQFNKNFGTKEALAKWEYLHVLAGEGKDILGSSCWSEAVYKKFTLYEKHLKFFQHIYQSKGIDDIREINQRFVHDAYRMMLINKGADIENPHIMFAMEMAVVGGEELTMRWVAQGMKIPKEVMLVLFQESIPKCICKYFV